MIIDISLPSVEDVNEALSNFLSDGFVYLPLSQSRSVVTSKDSNYYNVAPDPILKNEFGVSGLVLSSEPTSGVKISDIKLFYYDYDTRKDSEYFDELSSIGYMLISDVKVFEQTISINKNPNGTWTLTESKRYRLALAVKVDDKPKTNLSGRALVSYEILS